MNEDESRSDDSRVVFDGEYKFSPSSNNNNDHNNNNNKGSLCICAVYIYSYHNILPSLRVAHLMGVYWEAAAYGKE